MGKLITTNVDETAPKGDFIKPVIEPGNVQLKILSAELKKDAEYGDRIIFKCETPVIGSGFVGLKTIEDPNMTYLGQVGRIGYSKWGVRDFTSNSGVFYPRDEQFLKVLKTICVNLGITKWLDEQNEKHDSVDQLIEAFIKEKPFTGIFFSACVAGKEYLNKKNYVNYEMYFTQTDTSGRGFNIDEKKVTKFFPHLHIEKLKNTPSQPAAVDNHPTQAQTSLSLTDQINLEADTQKASMELKTGTVSSGLKTEQERLKNVKDSVDKATDANKAAQNTSANAMGVNEGECPYMPWEDGYAEWMEKHKKQ